MSGRVEALVTGLARLRNSRSGNPRWRIYTDINGTFITESDSQVAFDVQNRPAKCVLVLNPAGRVIDWEPR